MNIITKVEHLRTSAKKHGKLRILSEKSGVPYEWLCKFVYNKINNPGIKNLAELEVFFDTKH